MNTNEILTTILDRLTGVEGKLDNQGQKFILLDKKMDGMEQRFNQLDTKVDGMDQRITQLDEKMAGMDQKFSQLDAKVEVIDQRFNQLDVKVDSIGQGFTQLDENTRVAVTTLGDQIKRMDEKLDKNIVQKFEFDYISEKILYLEKEIFKLKQLQ